MEDSSSLFMEWAMDALVNEHPEPAVEDDSGEVTFPSLQALRDASHAAEMVQELMASETHDLASSWSSGDGEVTDGSSGGTEPSPPAAATDYHVSLPQSPNTLLPNAPAQRSSNTNLPAPVSNWNFVTGSAQPGSDGVLDEPVAAPGSLPPELVHRSPPSPPPPTRRAYPKSMGAATPDHVVAERKRREKINKRLIELSSVIPGLKKMDKATILTDAAKYVKELQQRLKVLEEAAAGSNAAIRSKAPPHGVNSCRSPTSSSSSSEPPAVVKRPALPQIEAGFSEKSAMVRIHCGGGKGVAATTLAEVEGLGLSIVHASVMPFSASTIIITITAKMDGLTLTAEQIIGRLKSALSHQGSSCNDAEDTEN